MSQNHTDRSSSEDIEWCYDAVHRVSRTFSLTISELNEPMARDICLGYLLCRVADTIEDAGHLPPAVQTELLRTYSRSLEPSSGTTVSSFHDAVEEWIPATTNADWEVVENADRIVDVFHTLDDHSTQTIRGPVRELVDGMAMFVDRYADAGGLRIKTLDELEEYCWYAAGTVGTLVTGLVSHEATAEQVARMEENARSFALLLQLVNVAKDAATDMEEENNVYLPLELLHEQGLDHSDVSDTDNVESLVPVIEQVTERAESYLDDAQAWLEAMPETRGNTLSAWAIPFLLAVGTIRELRERPADVIEQGNVKISREEVHSVTQQFVGDGDPSIGELRAKIRRQPLHQY
ncbi:phytoene/squalene synthase family protein [Haloarcula sp. 1CSR25-25]|uniref:phytoene/squalene synthase family protein n=1 Tax=Haloarcula sp. 1CSR25-25 TaxID=2862545 RepID=UPI002894BE4F|nr:phytoene/squalene synthase family protein [Haloarcula sp. 1CSR25-25]MDT3436642.1 squalene/phytoene synthase family protein [Haloarcula sp. 1CSR25-25]